jgi:hypothetical protein
MGHVVPFSRGGETSEGNLATLCESCNQGQGNHYQPQLIALAGLQFGWAPDILGNIDPDADPEYVVRTAMMISSNILITRCPIDDVYLPRQ